MDLKQISNHSAFYPALITVPVIALNYILFFGENSKWFRMSNLIIRTSIGLIIDKISSACFSFTHLLSPFLPSFLLPSTFPPSTSNGNYIDLESVASRLRRIGSISYSGALNVRDAASKVDSGTTSSTNKLVFEVFNDLLQNEISVIVKTAQGFVPMIMSLAGGRCREAIIYDNPPKGFPKEILPQTISTSYNTFFGSYTILIEDLSCLGKKKGISTVPVSHAFGNQIFGGSEININALIDFYGSKEKFEREVLKKAIELGAELHASFWSDKSLLQDYPYLNVSPWIYGKGRASWEENLRKLKHDFWPKALECLGEDLDERIIKLVNGYLDRSNWDNFQDHLKKEMEKGFTLVHGDFHANNMILVMDESNPNTPSTYLKLFDWSEVGIGFGEFDIGQMMISDVKPELRRKHERSLMENVYYPKIKAKDSSYTFDECWKRYGIHSLEKWLFIFPILASYPTIPKALSLYFQQQILEFVIDHAGFDYPYHMTSLVVLP